jgi:ankyrin repeat protein
MHSHPNQPMTRRGFLAAATAFALAIASQPVFPQTRPLTEKDRALIAAAGRGETEVVQRLLKEGASVEAADGNGVTALIAAAYKNHIPAAKLLVQAGSDVNRQDNTRQSAYLIATSEGYLELLRLTLAAGADVHRTDSYNGTGLIRAADRGHVEIIRELLRTALLEAVILGNGGERHTESVRLLVGAGANVNLADRDGITPLMHARRRGFSAMIEILERAGAR